MPDTPSRPTTGLNIGSHDLPVSAELSRFMASDWAASPLPDAARVPAYAVTPARRARLSARFPGERLIIPAGELKVRSHDCDYRFRPHSAYAWLTGLTGEDQVGHVLVLEPAARTGTRPSCTCARAHRAPAATRSSTATAATGSSGSAAAPTSRRRSASAASAAPTWTRSAHRRGATPPPTRNWPPPSPNCAWSRTPGRWPSCSSPSTTPPPGSRTSYGTSRAPWPTRAASGGSRGSSTAAPGPRATAPATRRSPRRARTPACSTGSATTAG